MRWPSCSPPSPRLPPWDPRGRGGRTWTYVSTTCYTGPPATNASATAGRFCVPEFFRDRTVVRHRAIVDALRLRDEEQALFRSAEHLIDAYRHVVQSYPEQKS